MDNVFHREIHWYAMDQKERLGFVRVLLSCHRTYSEIGEYLGCTKNVICGFVYKNRNDPIISQFRFGVNYTKGKRKEK